MRKSRYIIMLTTIVTVLALTMGCTKPDRNDEAAALGKEIVNEGSTNIEYALVRVDSAEEAGVFSAVRANTLKASISKAELSILELEKTNARTTLANARIARQRAQADAYSLSVAQSHWQTARQNQITSLQNYWLAYYHLRRLTLYDYQRHQIINKVLQ